MTVTCRDQTNVPCAASNKNKCPNKRKKSGNGIAMEMMIMMMSLCDCEHCLCLYFFFYSCCCCYSYNNKTSVISSQLFQLTSFHTYFSDFFSYEINEWSGIDGDTKKMLLLFCTEKKILLHPGFLLTYLPCIQINTFFT